MIKRYRKFFDVARTVAKTSDFRVKVGSVIVYNNDILSVATNTRKTHPLQAFHANLVGLPDKIYVHSEIAALVKLQNNLNQNNNRLKLFVFRETSDGLAWARPCKICMSAIKHYGIKNIFYTTNEGFAEEVLK